MARNARLTLLAILFIVVAALQVRLTWSTMEFVVSPETKHQRLPMHDSLRVNEDEFGGLRRDDRIVAVNGAPVATRWQMYQNLIRRPVGAPVDLVVERGGERVAVQAPSRGFHISTGERLFTVMQNIVTPWVSILLGFFIVWRRPLDRLAWLVLLVLLGLVQFYSYLFQTDAWHGGLAGALRVTQGWLLRMAPVAWLWFGLDFYAGRRLLPWLRWPVSVVLFYHAGQTALAALAGLHFPEWLPALEPMGLPRWLAVTATLAALVLGWANLVYRLAGETAPDTRRRLRVLVAGMVMGRGPAFLLEIAGLLGRPVASMPLAVWAPAIAAIFLVPVTFAYVLIVDRAMDVGVVVRQGLQYALARRSVDALRIALAIVPLALVENRWAAIGWSLGALVFVGPVAGRLRSWIDRRFFREAVQAEQVLAGMAEPLRAITDPARVLETVAGRVSQVLHVTSAQWWLADGGAAPAWLHAAGAEALALPVYGRQGVVGALHLGPKKSQEPYSPGERQLLESVAQQAGLAIENARLTQVVAEEAAQRERLHRELEIAKEVQARLLPKREPAFAGITLAGVCRPAQSIGGDSYDYVAADGRLVLTIADVAGKGVPAALLMSNLQAGLRGLLLAGGRESLAERLTQLNGLVFESTPANRFITLFALVLEPGGRELRYASAGHNPAALLRAGAGEVEWIRTKGLALGLKRQAAFEERGLTLAAGDTLVLYTDGVTEAVNAAGEEFGEGRLAEALGAARALGAAELRDAIVGKVDEFAAGAPQHDDITLVVLRAGE